jgi:hypothetical protein
MAIMLTAEEIGYLEQLADWRPKHQHSKGAPAVRRLSQSASPSS